MTNKELIKIVYELGAHPYSVGAMVAALQKGIEIGKQETIDKACKEFCCECMRENDRSCVCLDSSKCRLYIDFKRALEE